MEVAILAGVLGVTLVFTIRFLKRTFKEGELCLGCGNKKTCSKKMPVTVKTEERIAA